MPQRVSASQFKARCLALLDRVAQQRAEYVVTKRGRPVARLVPLDAPPPLEGSVQILVDDETWFSTGDLLDLPGEEHK